MKKIIPVLVIICAVAAFFVYIFNINSDSEQNSAITEAVAIINNIQNSVEAEQTLPDSYEISDFPYTLQTPELPTGCEITALTMAINYYGYDVDKVTMATSYLPTVPADMYYDENGIMHGADLNDYFIGDPETIYGYVCGTNAIVTAANDYFSDINSTMTAKDITGYSFEEMYELVTNDTPIVVWVTIDMAERSALNGWYTDDGSYVEWSQSDHAAVLVGYTDDTVIIADPLVGRVEYSRSDFESVYTSRGNKGVILEQQ